MFGFKPLDSFFEGIKKRKQDNKLIEEAQIKENERETCPCKKCGCGKNGTKI